MKKYTSVPYTSVNIDGGFWAYRQQLNRDVTTRAVMNRFKDTGRFDAFYMNWKEGMPNKPHYFWDSDVAKWIEGVAYLMKKGSVPEYEALAEEMIDCIEKGQGEDGYFNIYFTVIEPQNRFVDRSWHELYCAGHLIEAAVAYDEATGRSRFLKMMMKYADYIDRVFRLEQSAPFVTPGHEELELALVKLYRHTGEERYLQLAKFFIDQRGANDKDQLVDRHAATQRSVQSHMPVREMTTAEGHAVRAGYLYSAMADVARETDDESLLAACRAIFENIVLRRMYITGGVGSSRASEVFTVDYDLPNATSYTETCAAISMAYFARRMLTVEADSRYADLVERVIYNGFLSGVSLSGDRFFYTNPQAISLRDHGRNTSNPKGGEWLPITQRVEVFSCSCCPPNVTRFIASMGEYLYTTDEDKIFVHQYMESTANLTAGGREVCVRQQTQYPVSGKVKITVEGAKGLTVAVRIPGWCSAYRLKNGHVLDKGYAYIRCEEEKTEIALSIEMEPVLMEANPEVQADAGRVALMRGPVVYCLEGKDNGERLQDIRIGRDMDAQEKYDDLYKMPVVHARGWRRKSAQGQWLYRPAEEEMEEVKLTFIPYYAFANRGESDMQIWTLKK